jgi:hypothetical protein
MATQEGYLVIADITGYTAYLSKTELEHANEILESLLNTIISRIVPPLHISKLEGDAVFAYTPVKSFLGGQTLLEAVEGIYTSFKQSLEHMRLNTTCTCTACSLMPTLDLKFALHYGEFSTQKLGAFTELVGTDVNLVHRLMKNHVIEETGVETYAYITEAAGSALGLDDTIAEMIAHSESYDHLGEIKGYVHDLRPIWEASRKANQVMLRPEEGDLVIEYDLPVSPTLAWEYLNDPRTKAAYTRSTRFEVTGLSKGRQGVGTTHHCYHGDTPSMITITDWHPFEYMSFKTIPGGIPLPGLQIAETLYLTAAENGTHIVDVMGKPFARGPLFSWLTSLLWTFMMRKMVKEDTIRGFALVAEHIEADRQSGRLTLVEGSD